MAGLWDEQVRLIVKTKGEDESLVQIRESAIQEECEVKSQKYRNLQGSMPENGRHKVPRTQININNHRYYI